ncbi:MAG TPA: hypothetical protein VNB29_11650 [Chthoniobacterales bacterium]|nr:hypothetical protein [Chthoniobacterales bacterium]
MIRVSPILTFVAASTALWLGAARSGLADASGSEVLYDIDFSSPEHVLNQTPTAGTGIKKISGINSGSPTVRAISGVMTDRPVEFDAVTSYEQFQLNISKAATGYQIDFDVASHGLRNSQYDFDVTLDTPQVRTVDFHGGSNTTSVYQPSGGSIGSLPFQDDQIYHVTILVDISGNKWKVYRDGTLFYSAAFGATGLQSIRFNLSPWIGGAVDGPNTKVALDNIRVVATTSSATPTPTPTPTPVPTPTPGPTPEPDFERVVFNFDGAPTQPVGTATTINKYEESGFIFKPLGEIATQPPYDLVRRGGGSAFYPENSSNYLQLLSGDSLEVYGKAGEHFRPISVDLAEYSTVYAVPTTIGFRGIKANGDVVEAQFVTDGQIDGTGSLVDFQTFTFPETFTDLVRIEATTDRFSLDNLVIDKEVTSTSTPTPTPAPTATPTVTSRPEPDADRTPPQVAVFGGARRQVREREIVLRGSADDDRAVKRVEIQTGNGPFFQAESRGKRWSQSVTLKKRRNLFLVRAVDASGNISATKRIVVTWARR